MRIARHFWGAWDELSIEAGLFKGTTVCVPPELFKCTLVDLHEACQGREKKKAQVREAVYWSGINADIVNYVH